MEQDYLPDGYTGFYEMNISELKRYARSLEKIHHVSPPFNLRRPRSEIEHRIKEILDKAKIK